MSKVLVTSFGSNAFADNTTRYFPVVGYLTSFGSEDATEVPVRDSGTFSNLFVYASANTTLVNSVITLRKSRADTTSTVTFASGETGIKEDTTHSVTFANTDEMNFSIVVANDASGAKTITLTLAGIEFEADSNCISFFNLNVLTWNLLNASETKYICPVGAGSVNATTTEADAKYRSRFSFTSSDFEVAVVSNTRTTNTVFRTRKNGAAGSQSVTYGSGETGHKEDTSNTDSLTAGDDFNNSFTTGTGTGTLSLNKISTSVINSTNTIFPLLSGKATGEAITFNTTTYMAVEGNLDLPTTTEAQTQIYPRFDFTAKELASYVSANTIATSPSTITLRDNGADSSVTVSYNAAETGLKNDTTNTATISSGTDEINYKITTPNTSGSLTLTWIGVLGETVSVSTVSTVVQAIMF